MDDLQTVISFRPDKHLPDGAALPLGRMVRVAQFLQNSFVELENAASR